MTTTKRQLQGMMGSAFNARLKANRSSPSTLQDDEFAEICMKAAQESMRTGLPVKVEFPPVLPGNQGKN